jgi:D-serine deaminase-like pyridoxal phosphate-dependent protein
VVTDTSPVTSQAQYVGRPLWEIDTPALLVDLSVMERNVERMARTFREAGVGWRPHTKGLKVPAIAHKLLQAGAFGVTCAKVGEAEVMARAGIRDILIANQVVGQPKIARLLDLLQTADPIVAVDSVANVDQLDRAARERGVRLRVVVEVNTGMDRAGVEPGGPAVELSAYVASRSGLRYAGLMGWEGHAVKIASPAEKRTTVVSAVGSLTDTATQCRAAGLPVDIVSCGGTGTYTITSGLAGVTEVQAGGGILCDVMYSEFMGVEHEFASTILATVTSRPTPTRIICDAGKKAMSSDAATPRPRLPDPIKSVGLSAEHATIKLLEPNTSIQVGDKLEFIVGYTDTTTMLHDELYGIRNGKVEAVWPILGRGKFR